MISRDKHIITLLFVLVPWCLAIGQHGPRFKQNKGQWHSNVVYKADLASGYLFLEDDAFTYLFYDTEAFKGTHGVPDPKPRPSSIDAHAVKVNFTAPNEDVIFTTERPSTDYSNYFIGNDPSKWASHVYAYRKVNYWGLYDYIDLSMYQYTDALKYDFIVHPGGDPSEIEMTYEGADDVRLEEGRLIVETSIETITELPPKAYQLIDGEEVEVECHFKLSNGRLSFDLPKGYDASHDLIIDPILTFSTYTGSTADNFGFTASYDLDGHAYGGGVAFDAGYPTTTGAYQMTFAAGGTQARTDMAITKFTPDGSGVIYSTYIGGTVSSEAPHSLVVNDQNELYILGTTGSSDFPMLATSYDDTHDGGTNITPQGSGVVYFPGSDIVVAKLNAAGSVLLGSTFIGGTENDGLNEDPDLLFFYGDIYRGEIIVDGAGNAIVATTTKSADFPTTAGAAQTTFGGGDQDGVIFQFNSDLSNLMWSSYWGGSGDDSGYGLQRDSNGNLFMTGATTSANLNTQPAALNNAWIGATDGYVAKFDPAGAFLNCSYIGTAGEDATYFVQLDTADNVYLFGVSDGGYPTTGGVYSNPGSGQFIQKVTNDLNTGLVSTVVGSGSGNIDFSPTAFLISECNHIYLSGWAGPLNNAYKAPNSTTNGLPVTPNATQASTDGSDFYVMELDGDAQNLVFSTFFGGANNEHVDGGTSRFDKRGFLYQAVCAGCGGNSSFPTTTGVWSNTNNSPNCNLALFKYGLDPVIADADFDADITVGCGLPFQVDFQNTSVGETGVVWDFGDGTGTSSDNSPSHFYNQYGTYTVTLIAVDTTDCGQSDTVLIDVTIPEPVPLAVTADDTICQGDEFQLNVTGGVSYSWSPTDSMTGSNTANPIVNPSETTTYYVTATDSLGCQTLDSVTVFVNSAPPVDAGADISYEFQDSLQIIATAPTATSYNWSPPDGLSCTTCLSPYISNPYASTAYVLTVSDANGCTSTDTVIVFLSANLFVPNAFTPNGDGKNEIFRVYAQGLDHFEFWIFDRWGQVVFYTNDIEAGWNGEHNGVPCKVDTYVWMIKYTEMGQPEVFHKKHGHVTIVK